MDMSKALQKAVSTAAGAGGDFIPTPLSRQFIKYIWEQNFLRQAFRKTNMTATTKDTPKILQSTKVYYQPTEAGTSQKTSFKTGTIRLEAKKFMSQLNLTMEIIEDSQEDIRMITKDHFAATLAGAEEEAMIVGDPSHATTSDENLATEALWFDKDHRLIFYGLLPLSGDIAGSIEDDTRAANRVDAAGSDATTSIVRQALFNMGKYGRNFNDVIMITNPWSASQLMDDPALKTVDKYGPQATIHTGEIGRLYGKTRVINSGYCTDGYSVLTNQKNPIIGDRRLVTLKEDENISDDVIFMVITERVDFTVDYKGALCQIFDLDLPDYSS